MRILQQIHDLIKVSAGIDLATVGGSPLARGVKKRMARCGLADESSYIDLIKKSPEELDELVELIVVPETWFFRDEKPFALLQKYVSEEWMPSCPGIPIKILSLPCSSGEEPYTIAMALLDIGLSPEQMRIEAFDISRQALEKAQMGMYHRNSFRSRDMGFRERYFHLTDEGYVLGEKVRRCVAFSRGNVMMPGFAVGKGPYDVVFFRNLMIYLAPKQQDESMAVIDKLLSPSGVLFVGHAESLQALNRGYSPVRYPFCFAYRKSNQCVGQNFPTSMGIRQQRQDDKRTIGTAARSIEYGGSQAIRNTLAPWERTEVNVVDKAVHTGRDCRYPEYREVSVDSLALAFEMADKGRTDDARKLCEASLSTSPPKADAYYLLGLLQKSQGFAAEAEICLRKAVYLQPDHVQALAHLALAAEERGDMKAAELFRLRARQAHEKQTRN